MAASKDTVRQILEVIRRHVDKDTERKILKDLRYVPGNASFRQTVARLTEEADRS